MRLSHFLWNLDNDHQLEWGSHGVFDGGFDVDIWWRYYIYIYILAQPVFRGIDITIKNPDISNEE